MAVITDPIDTAPAVRRRLRRWWVVPLVAVPACFAATCWWLTASLDDPEPSTPVAAAAPVATPAPEPLPSWPEGRLDGEAAKRRLLDLLVGVTARLEAVEAYTATFHKQERLKGKLGAEQTIDLKVRHRPFAVYMRFHAPQDGKEVVFAEGRNGDKMIAHGGGFARLLVPRLAVAPDHPLALADSRHAITEAGLANLAARLVGFRKMDLEDPEAETVLDKITDAKGRVRLRSVHRHPHYHEGRPFARVEVLYDLDTTIPVDIRSFDWPGKGGDSSGELVLAEHYSYDDLNFEAPLASIDFDPANPSYQFHRY